MDQSCPTLKAFVNDAPAPGTWIVTDGRAGYEGLENQKAVAVGDTPAYEALDWIHRVFSNLKRWGLGVLHGFRCKHLDWQLVECEVMRCCARCQFFSGTCEWCMNVPAVTEVCFLQSRHWWTQRFRLSRTALLLPQSGQTNPSGQRRRNRSSAHASSSGNMSLN